MGQNVSLVNTVLATITAAAFKEFADAIEKGQAPAAVARAALQSAWKVGGRGTLTLSLSLQQQQQQR